MLVSIEIKYVNPPKEGGEGQFYCRMFNFMIPQTDRDPAPPPPMKCKNYGGPGVKTFYFGSITYGQ